MKKLFVLASVLALAACGGGSGGGGFGGNTSADFVDTVGESNSVITGMRSNSRYQVARYVANKLGEDANSVNLSRGATTRGAFVPSASTGDTNYDIARELVDLAAWLANDSTSESDIISMFNNSNIDKNKIKAALKLLDDMWCFVGGSAEKTAERILQHRASFQAPLAELQQNTEVFDLENTSFKTASLLLNTGSDSGAVVKFKTTPDGTIKSIELSNDVMNANVERQGNGNIFLGDYICEDVEGGETETGILQVLYESNSKKHNLGLQYSDFGVIKWGDPGQEYDTVTYFAGGYQSGDENREIKSADIVLTNGQSITFSGVADGVVVVGDWAETVASNLDKRYLDTTTNANEADRVATLTFDNTGTSTLSAKFDNWYDVTAVYNVPGGSTDGRAQLASLTFSNGDKPTFLPSYDSDGNVVNDFKWHGENNFVALPTGEDYPIYPEGVTGGNRSIVRDGFVEYYGDNGNPTEAVAIVKYGDSNGTSLKGSVENNDLHSESLRFDMGFGGIRN